MSLDFMNFPSSMDLTDEEKRANDESVAKAGAAIEQRELIKAEALIERYECVFDFCHEVTVITDDLPERQVKDQMCTFCYSIVIAKAVYHER